MVQENTLCGTKCADALGWFMGGPFAERFGGIMSLEVASEGLCGNMMSAGICQRKRKL